MLLRLAVLASTLSLGRQQDFVTVTVLDANRRPIPSVEVLAEGAMRRVVGRTNQAGLVRISGREAGQMLSFRHLGYQPERLRWSREYTTVTLTTIVRRLDQLRVVAPPQPKRPGVYAAPGESERVQGLSSAFFGAGQLGDLAEIARQFGGGDGDASFGGMPAGLSRVSIAGAQTSASRLPRRAATTIIVRNSPYDPSIGGFASSALEADLHPGSSFAFSEVASWNSAVDVGRRGVPTSTLSYKRSGQRGGWYFAADADVEVRGGGADFVDCRGTTRAPRAWQPFLRELVDAARVSGYPPRCSGRHGGTATVVSARLDRPTADGGIASVVILADQDVSPVTSPSALSLSGAGVSGRRDGLLVSVGYRDTSQAAPRFQHRLAMSASRDARGREGTYVASEAGDHAQSIPRPPLVSIAGAEGMSRTTRAALEGALQARVWSQQRTVVTATAFGRIGTAQDVEASNPVTTFATPYDLAVGSPAEVRGVGASYDAIATSAVGGTSLGFVHNLRRDILLLGGARIEGLVVRPEDGPVGQTVAVSPRLALEWAPDRMDERGLDMRGGAALDQLGFGAVRLGIGRYIAWPDEAILADRSQRLHLPAPVTCGRGVPDAPLQCPIGTGITAAAPPAFALGVFRPASNWRVSGSGEFTSPVGTFAVDAALSRTTGELLTRDANLGQAVGVVDDGRPFHGTPVFLPAGRGPLLSSRRDASRGFVFVSDSRGTRVVSEFTVAFRPKLPDRVFVQLAGTVRRADRARSSVEWSAADAAALEPARGVARTQAMLNTGMRVTPGIRLSGMLTVMSGMPFLPVVGADANGDGLANDPLTPFATVAPSSAWNARQQRCLSALSRGASACARPPTMSSWLQVDVGGNASRYRGLRDRLRVSIWWANPLAVAFPGLPGIGQALDERIAMVTGYDSVGRRFRYAPNPAFLQRVSGVDGIPWRAGVNVVFALHEDFPTQGLRANLVEVPSGPEHVARVVARYRRIVRNPWSLALSDADLIGLDPVQLQAFQREEERVDAMADSIWTALVQRSLQARGQVAIAQLVDWQEAAIRDAWELMKHQRSLLLPLITVSQRQRLPWFLDYLMTVEKPLNLRLR